MERRGVGALVFKIVALFNEGVCTWTKSRYNCYSIRALLRIEKIAIASQRADLENCDIIFVHFDIIYVHFEISGDYTCLPGRKSTRQWRFSRIERISVNRKLKLSSRREKLVGVASFSVVFRRKANGISAVFHYETVTKSPAFSSPDAIGNWKSLGRNMANLSKWCLIICAINYFGLSSNAFPS